MTELVFALSAIFLTASANTVGSDCIDHDHRCLFWASKDNCWNYHVKTSCRRSCNIDNCSNTSCGQTFYNSSHGVITSPRWPKVYEPNMNCTYTIEAEHGQIIRLTYNYVDLALSGMCLNFITVSFITGIWPALCQDPQHFVRSSNDNLVTINFDSWRTVSGTGFMITYEALYPDPACGQTFYNSSHGVITSPGWPNVYPPNLECTYTIEAEHDQVIWLTFDHLDLERSQNGTCTDFLTINYITGSSSAKCENPHNIERNSIDNVVTITFHSNAHTSNSGFVITYEALYQDPACGQTFFNHSRGYVTSPGWPNEYPPNLDCTYTITVVPETKLAVRLSDISFNLTSHWERGCEDFVTISNNYGPRSTYCADSLANWYTVLYGSVVITFHSNSQYSGTGFKFFYYLS